MSPRPRVVLEALQVRAPLTGPGTAIVELCRALAAEDRGFDATVLAARPELFAFLAGRPGWSVHDCAAARGGAWRKAWFLERRVPALVRDGGGALLHCPQFLAPGRPAVPLVTTVYDLAWRAFPETVEWSRRLYYRWAVPRALAGSAAILAPSEATAAEIIRHHPETAPRIRVIPLAAASGGASKGRGAGRNFLFVGTLEPRKNLARLLDAYGILLEARGAESVPDLVLAGPDGWRDGAIRRRLDDLAATGKVRRTGYCTAEELSAHFQDALALLFPSLHEGFGMPILEAMTAGVPVLTSDRGAMAEVAGRAALFVDPEDTAAMARAMGRLLDDAALRARLSETGYVRAQEFDWSRTAAATAEVYRSLLAGIEFK